MPLPELVAPLTQHYVKILGQWGILRGCIADYLTWIVLSPGQAPGTKEPPQESLVLMHIPEPDEVLQVFLTQHCTSSGSLGQYDLRLKPCEVQLDVFWQVPAPSYCRFSIGFTGIRKSLTGVLHEDPIERTSRGSGTKAKVTAAREKQKMEERRCMMI